MRGGFWVHLVIRVNTITGPTPAELVLTKHTAETHITRIRATLGFNERAQIVRWAIAAGLVPSDDQIHL